MESSNLDSEVNCPSPPASSLREHHVGDEGGFIERHLFAASRFDHVDAHPFHHRADLEAGCGHMLQQGRRERAVAAVAVKGDMVWLGGKRSQRADRVLNGREALLAGPRLAPEWAVAAGIEEDQV